MQFGNHGGVLREETEIFLGSPFQMLKRMHLAFLPAHQREHVLILSNCFEIDQLHKEVPDNFNVDPEYVKRPASCGDESDGLLSKEMRLAG